MLSCGLLLASLPALICSLPSPGTYYSSMYNDLHSDLGTDNNPATCFESGFERGAWWATVLPAATNVTGVTVRGSARAIQVRVGNVMSEYGHRGNFRDNTLCAFRLSLGSGEDNVYSCQHSPHKGAVISVQLVDLAYSEQLTVCDVTLHSAM